MECTKEWILTVVLAVGNVNIGKSFTAGDVSQPVEILFMVHVSWLLVHAKKEWTFVANARIFAARCFTVIPTMTRRAMIRREQGLSGAVR